MTEGSVLVLGGARSGKSSYAEKAASASGLEKVYIATGQPHDSEMQDRIRAHRERRDDSWITVDTPIDLVGSLTDHCGKGRAVLVDCLTLWLSNLFMADRNIEEAYRQLVDSVADKPGLKIFVSNEVGSGIVPENALGRRFRDVQGRLNQQMAAICDSVVLTVAGLPLVLKGKLPT